MTTAGNGIHAAEDWEIIVLLELYHNDCIHCIAIGCPLHLLRMVMITVHNTHNFYYHNNYYWTELFSIIM